jgi:hypothetical protein
LDSGSTAFTNACELGSFEVRRDLRPSCFAALSTSTIFAEVLTALSRQRMNRRVERRSWRDLEVTSVTFRVYASSQNLDGLKPSISARRVEEIDTEVASWLAEAYRVGEQRHLS